MKTGSSGYLIRQGIANTWLNRVMSLASIGILTACLILLGGVALITLNMRDAFIELQNRNEVIVYLKDDITDSQATKVGNTIKGKEYVDTCTYVSRTQALEIYKQSMGDRGYLLDLLEDDNPLPASYNVTMHNLDSLSAFVLEMSGMPGVYSVNAPTELADIMSGIRNILFVVGGIIIGILFIASIVVINNTIKLTVFSRRKEISIMRYVGATNGFIKLPFKVEGITIGFISASIAFLVISGVYIVLQRSVVASSASWLQWMSSGMIPYGTLWYYVLGAFMVFSILIGIFGSSSAMRKHLSV